MSHIPSKAMPHAGGSPESNDHGGLDPEQGGEETGGGPTLGERAGKLRNAVRDNPKTAIAAGVAIAGVAAAVAVPRVRARRKAGDQEGGAKESGGKAKKKKKD